MQLGIYKWAFYLLLPRWQRPAQVLLDAVTMTTLILWARCWFRALKIKSSCKVCWISTTFIVTVVTLYILSEKTEIWGFLDCIKCVTHSGSRLTLQGLSLMTKLNPAFFYRLASDPSRLLEREFCTGGSQLHSLQWRGWVCLQGQWLLVQLWPQVPRVQLPLHGHPSHGGEPGKNHRDMEHAV